MTEQREGQEQAFQSFLENLYAQVESSDSFQKIRTKAWEQFLKLGLPTKKNDVFRYIRLNNFFANSYEISAITDIAQSSIDKHVLPECQQSVAIFINGHFSPMHSRLDAIPKNIVIETIAEGMKTYGSFLQNQSTKSLKDELDPFAALNAAVNRDGLFLYVPPKTMTETPLQLLNIIDAGSMPMFVTPRAQIFVGMQSEISVVSTLAVLSGESYTFNMVAEFAIEDAAKATYTQSAADLNANIWHFDAVRASLKRDSRFKTINVTSYSGCPHG